MTDVHDFWFVSVFKIYKAFQLYCIEFARKSEKSCGYADTSHEEDLLYARPVRKV